MIDYELQSYPGSKNAHGLWQWIINHIPAHDRYFELFAGTGAIYRKKKPAKISQLNERDYIQFHTLKDSIPKREGTSISNEDALHCFDGLWDFNKNDFIYLDPPYPFSCRRCQEDLYNLELDDDQHRELLLSIRDLECNVMISTRQNDLYDIGLKDWHKEQFLTANRGGPVMEIIYMNYDISKMELHQYDYIGLDCTDRQRIKRKVNRNIKGLNRLPLHERMAVIEGIVQTNEAAVKRFLTT